MIDVEFCRFTSIRQCALKMLNRGNPYETRTGVRKSCVKYFIGIVMYDSSNKLDHHSSA